MRCPAKGTWGSGTITPSPTATTPACRSSNSTTRAGIKAAFSRFLQVSRPTVDAWIRRFEAEHFAGLMDKSPAPHAPARKVWLPLMVQVYHLQKAHPDAGRFRIWSLLARSDISERTVGRIMALNKLVYHDIPHVPTRGVKPAPGPHPYKASHRHQYWFIDGRRMDFALDGVRWWSLIILEGYSRTMLAGMIAPTEATWVALMVLYTACLRYGAPCLSSPTVAGPIPRTTLKRSVTDCRFSMRRSSAPKARATRTSWRRISTSSGACMTTSSPWPARRRNSSSAIRPSSRPTTPRPIRGCCRIGGSRRSRSRSWGRPKAGCTPRRSSPAHFSQAVFPRTTNRYGCVTLHSYHFYVEAGLPQTQVLLWVAGTQLRAAFDHVILAEYHCRYDWRDRRVKEVRQGVVSPHPLCVAAGHPPPVDAPGLPGHLSRAGQASSTAPPPTPQLLLFEVVPTA